MQAVQLVLAVAGLGKQLPGLTQAERVNVI